MRPYVFLFLALSFAPSAQAVDFGLFAGTHFGFGYEGSDLSDFYRKRQIGVLDLQAMPGYPRAAIAFEPQRNLSGFWLPFPLRV